MLAADDHTFGILENRLNVRTRANFDCLHKVYEYLQEEIHNEKSQPIDPNLLRTKRHAQEVKKRQLIAGIQLEKERLLFTIEDMRTRSANLTNDTLTAQARVNNYLHDYEMKLVHQKTKWMLRVQSFTTRIMDDVNDQGDETSVEYRARERENTAIYYCQYNFREVLCTSPIVFEEDKLRAELLETKSTALRYSAMELLSVYCQTLSANWDSGKFNLAQRLDPLFLYYLPITMFSALEQITQHSSQTISYEGQLIVLLPVLLRACEYYLELSHRALVESSLPFLIIDREEELLHKLNELRKDPHQLANNNSNMKSDSKKNSRSASRIGRQLEGKEMIQNTFRSLLFFQLIHQQRILSLSRNLTKLCDLFCSQSESVAVLKSLALCRTTITSSLLRVGLFTLSLLQKVDSASFILPTLKNDCSELLFHSALHVASQAASKRDIILGIPGHLGSMVVSDPFQMLLLVDMDLIASMDMAAHYLSSYDFSSANSTTSNKLEKMMTSTTTFASPKATATPAKLEKSESKLIKSASKVTTTVTREEQAIHAEKLELERTRHIHKLGYIIIILSAARNATFHRGMSTFFVTSFLHLTQACSTFLMKHATLEANNSKENTTESSEDGGGKSVRKLDETVEKCRSVMSTIIERVMAVAIFHKLSVSITRLVMLNLRLLLRELFIGRMALEDGLSRNLLPILDIWYDGKPLLSLAAKDDDDDDNKLIYDHADDNQAPTMTTATPSTLQLQPPPTTINDNSALAEGSTSLLEDSLSWMSSGDEGASPIAMLSPSQNQQRQLSSQHFFSSSVTSSGANSPTHSVRSQDTTQSHTRRKKSSHHNYHDDENITIDPTVQQTLQKIKTEGIPRILRHYLQHGVKNDFVRLPGVNSVTVGLNTNINPNNSKKKGRLDDGSITSVELIASGSELINNAAMTAIKSAEKTSLADLLTYCAETHAGHNETLEQVLLLIEHIAAKSQVCKFVLSEAGLPLVLQRYLESKPKSVYLVALASLCAEALEIR